MPVLEANQITKHFAGIHALIDVDFRLDAGEILGLIGPNGAGKTTLVNVITGTISATRGEVRFQGRTITGFSPDRLGRLGISRTFQIMKPFPNITVLDNVAVGALFGKHPTRFVTEARQRALKHLEFVGLQAEAGKLAHSLTVAARKRLELAKALAMEPDVLLLDEVMAGLNPSEVETAVKLIRSIRDQGISILVIEHVMQAIQSLSDRIMVLHHGRKIADDAPDKVMNDPTVIKAYLGRRYGGAEGA